MDILGWLPMLIISGAQDIDWVLYRTLGPGNTKEISLGQGEGFKRYQARVDDDRMDLLRPLVSREEGKQIPGENINRAYLVDSPSTGG
jgi:hypothetical protein